MRERLHRVSPTFRVHFDDVLNLFLHYHRTPLEQAPNDGFYQQQQAKSCAEVVAHLRSVGAIVQSAAFDFTDLTSVPRLFDEAERAYGQIDVLVNNAAAWHGDTFLPSKETSRNPYLALWTEASPPVSADSAAKQFAVNAGAPALLMREFARRHVWRAATWGRIINLEWLEDPTKMSADAK